MYKLILSVFIFIDLVVLSPFLMSQEIWRPQQVPSVYSGIMPDKQGQLFFLPVTSADTAWLKTDKSLYTPDHLMREPTRTKNGLAFDFNNTHFFGTIYFGLFPDDSGVLYSLPNYTKSVRIIAGTAQLDLSSMFTCDTIKIGYRIVDQYGRFLYNGTIRINIGNHMEPLLTIIEGPFVNLLDDHSAVVSFVTNQPCNGYIIVDNHSFKTSDKVINLIGENNHVIKIDQLLPDTAYDYEVHFGNFGEKYSFTTNPVPGSRNLFAFAFTSNSRSGIGGERDVLGVNAFLLQKAAALAAQNRAVFFQFAGDLISGYVTDVGEANMQYINWKKTIEPYAHFIPYYTCMGEHESVECVFDDGSKYGMAVDKFPFAEFSAEQVFSNHFIHPENGPYSEDGADYDPHSDAIDFPSYLENVYYYTYDNLAVVVLNTSFWFTPSAKAISSIGGNPSGYLMDNQLTWLSETIQKFEQDENIDHVVVVMNAPVFPAGIDKTQGMWYGGSNAVRPVVAADRVSTGIIERRDALLNIIINQSLKTAIVLSSVENGYSRMKLSPSTDIYPTEFRGKKQKLSREIWQISCGLSGQGSVETQIFPWTESIERSTRQPSVAFFQIAGKSISMQVVNPQTLELIEEVQLK